MKKYFCKSLSWIYLIAFGLMISLNKLLAAQPDYGSELENIQRATKLADPEGGPEGLTLNIIQTVLGIIGLISVIMIIYSGFSWMTAAGNEEKLTKAKKTLRTSIFGLIIILLSWTLVTFVFDTALKVTN